ncbi:MAG: sigma-54-dependent transcriptional regulator [Acidobacteriota bacterium]
MMKASILIVDDEVTFRERFARTLERTGYRCHAVGDIAGAHQATRETDFDVAFVDIRLPDGSGVDLLAQLADRCPQTAVVMVTAYAGLETAVHALRRGAIDYLEKPFAFDQALNRLARLLEYRDTVAENQLLRQQLQEHRGTAGLIGESAAMQEVFRLIEQVAPTWSTVLISGESGTGKELVARAIYQAGPTARQRFVPVNCAAIPADLLESELFGHERGAFTGATRLKRGMFELADGGCLFLDEIAELPLQLQAKLLRALESGEISRVGGTKPIPVRTRLLVATNRELAAEVAAGRFRDDVYYRIKVVEIVLPPLRSRREDIPLLARHFVERYRRELKRQSLGVSNAAMRQLLAYRWPGNVRELENVIERAMILGHGEWIEPQDLPADLSGAVPVAGENLREALRVYEREHIRSVLAATNDDRQRAAEQLGIGLSTLYRKLQELGLADETEAVEEPSPSAAELRP